MHLSCMYTEYGWIKITNASLIYLTQLYYRYGNVNDENSQGENVDSLNTWQENIT